MDSEKTSYKPTALEFILINRLIVILLSHINSQGIQISFYTNISKTLHDCLNHILVIKYIDRHLP